MTVVVKNKILVVAGNLSHLDQFVIHGFFKELSEYADVLLALPQSEVESQHWANGIESIHVKSRLFLIRWPMVGERWSLAVAENIGRVSDGSMALLAIEI